MMYSSSSKTSLHDTLHRACSSTRDSTDVLKNNKFEL